MESKKKRSRAEDAEMGSTTTDDMHPFKGERRIAKGKRRAKELQPIIDQETGEEIEYEDDSSELEEERNAVYMDEQEVVQHESDEDGIVLEDDKDEEWGDVENQSMDGENKKTKQKKAKKQEEEP